MAPKKRTAEEQVQWLNQRALKVKNKDTVDKIIKVIRGRTDLALALASHLRDLGVEIGDASAADGSGKVKEEEEEGTTPTKDKGSGDGETPNKSDGDGSSSSVGAEGQQAGNGSGFKVAPYIPRKYDTIASLPPEYLKHILSVLEPISLGPNTLKGIATSRKKVVAKPPILQLVELCTDLDGNTPIKPWMRHMPALLSALKDMNVRKGRPAKELLLPPDYAKDGIWGLRSVGDELFVVHRGQQFEKQIPGEALRNIKDRASLYIETNWSTRRATLVEAGMIGGILIISYFPEISTTIVEPPPGTEEKDRTPVKGEQGVKRDLHDGGDDPPAKAKKEDLASLTSAASSHSGTAAPVDSTAAESEDVKVESDAYHGCADDEIDDSDLSAILTKAALPSESGFAPPPPPLKQETATKK